MKNKKNIGIKIFLTAFMLLIGAFLWISYSHKEVLDTRFALPSQETLDRLATTNPIVWESDLVLVNLGEVDYKNETFWGTFALIIKSDDPRTNFLENKPQLSFMNSREIELFDENVKKNYYEVTIRGVFFSKFDISAFPFSTLELNVFIEPKTPNSAENVVFQEVSDRSLVDSFFSVPGWRLSDSLLTTYMHEYTQDLTFSRLMATFVLEKNSIGAILKTLFPVTIIMLIALMSFFIKGNYTIKIYMTAMLLYPLVYLHLSVIKPLPDVGYLTYFDKIMIIYYLVFFNAILNAVRQTRIHFHTNSHDHSHRFNVQHLQAIPVLIAITAFVLFAFL